MVFGNYSVYFCFDVGVCFCQHHLEEEVWTVFVNFGGYFDEVSWCFRKKVEVKKKSSKYILKSTLTPSLARKQLALKKSNSANSLHKSHSCSSLDGTLKPPNSHGYNNYLTVHVSNEGFRSIPNFF